MARIYVSYANEGPEHEAWVRSVVLRLRRAGHETFFFPDEISPGENWPARVSRGLAEADVVVVIATPEYARRAVHVSDSGVAYEWSRLTAARDEHRPVRVIPIVRRGTPYESLPSWLRDVYAIDATDDDQFIDAMQRLDRALGAPVSAPGDAGPRYLRRVELSNVKLARDLTISFEAEDGSPRMWTCLLGDNGAGKTSVLQAIALAATGAALGGKLVGDARDFVSVSPAPVTAAIACEFTGGLSTRLQVRPGSFQWEGAGPDDERVNEQRRHRRPGFFVAAFGTSRRLARPGQVALPSDPIVDRVRGVFDSGHRMLGLEFGEALASYGLRDAYLAAVDQLVRITDEQGPVLPGLRGLERTAEDAPGARPGDVVASFEAGADPFRLAPHLLSAGYQSVLAWIGDLIGHLLLERAMGGLEPSPPEAMAGIVLIDEIDLHLHPAWQRRVGPILRVLFPKLQFVVTTHAPIVVAGFAPSEIVRLGLRDGAVVVLPDAVPDPRFETTTSVLTSWFGVPTAAPPALKDAERRLLRERATSDGAPAGERSDRVGLVAPAEPADDGAFLRKLLRELGQ
jgi:predicted ATPase